jgi:LPS-assembly lipoprotein
MNRSALLSLAFLAPAFLVLGACGFTPVYGRAGANDGPIHIAEISGRSGHFLRQELVRTVGQGLPGLNSGAELTISLKESIARLGFAPDQAASRSDYIGAATWALRTPDGKLIASGGAREAASFNYADAAYADIAAQTAAQERVATLLARTIRDQMIIEIGRPKPAKKTTLPPSTTVTGAPPPPAAGPLPAPAPATVPADTP